MGTPDEPSILRPRLGRRRELSCNSCRQRKRKCDRQKPCSHCIRHHLEPTCTYAGSSALCSPSRQFHAISPTAQHLREDSSTFVSELGGLATPSSSAFVPSPETTDLRLTESGTGFKDSTHWTSVLSGVTEAKGQDDPQGGIQSKPAFDGGSSPLDQNILLFEGCKHATNQELLDLIPPRRECDGLVALYFRAQEYRSVIHPTEFLKRYNAFWENPSATSVSWLGLLYSIFCLTSQVQSQKNGDSRAQNNASSAWSSTVSYKILKYREKVVQCLVQGHFAKGGPDIMETLVHYLLIESYLNRDSNIEVWLLMSNIVQVAKKKIPLFSVIFGEISLREAWTAIRMGYHRDPRHFRSLSPYQGEMRRRMWAVIYSLDIGFATQVGLPSSIKHSLSDTMPPGNLQDRDFDASSTNLPPTRPIDELTSSTVIIAKLHVATSLGVILDKVCSPHRLSCEDLVVANSTLDITYATIPNPCKLRPMSESLLDPPSILFQRINLYMHYQRARILVNWKFISTSKDTVHGNQSWGIVIEAAFDVLRLQQRIAEESEVLDTFRPTFMVDSCFINNGFFLAASIACFLVQHRKDRLSVQDLLEVRSLLEKSLAIWSGTDELSKEASKVVTALRVVLGTPEDPSIDTTIEGRASLQADGDTFDRTQMALSSCTSFFDGLPLMMTDDDNTAFLPSLSSIPMIDYWPQLFDHEELAEILLTDKRINPDLTARPLSRTPLLDAALKKNEAMVRLLLKAGANKDIQDIKGLSPAMLLDAASAEDRYQLIQRRVTRNIRN